MLGDIVNRDLKSMTNCGSQYAFKLRYANRGGGSPVGGDGRKHPLVYIKQAPDHTQATFMESLLCIFIIFIKQMVRQNKKFSSP